MRRQTQERGVKLWSGNDLLDLQHECLKICDRFLGQFGDGILSGCKVEGTNITEGLVFLDGRVIPFNGAQNVRTFPVYLITKTTDVPRLYADGSYQAIAFDYEAEMITSIPAQNYVEVNTRGNETFFEMLQNDSRLFFTKEERDKLAAIQEGANKIVVDNSLNRMSKNPVENGVVAIALSEKADKVHQHDYLPLTGGTLTGKLTVPSSNATDENGGAIEIREYGLLHAQHDSWHYSPGITFNWGNRYTKRFGLRADGYLAVDNEPLLTTENYKTYVNTKDEVTNAITEKTTDAEIYAKKIQSPFTPTANPTDIVVGDTLHNSIQKTQGYINKFKRATGVQVATDFAPSSTYSAIAANDTVDMALRKTQKFMNDVNETSLPDLLLKTQFDYVVSDSQSLYNLRNNPNAKSVLIKSGIIVLDTDVFPETLNLHDNTKMIVGEPGSVIQVTGSVEGGNLFAHAQDGNNTKWGGYDVSFHNLEIRSTASFVGGKRIFHRTRNCYNCRVIDDFGKFGYAFSYVENIYDCYVRATGMCYFYCNKLVNCRAEPAKSLDKDANHYGYWVCDYLTNCEADFSSLSPTTRAQLSTTGFYLCEFLTGCISRVTGCTPLYGFRDCKQLSSCGAYFTIKNSVENGSTDTLMGAGFRGCARIVSCYSNFKEEIPVNASAYGFTSCSSMGFNYSSGNPTAHYNNCIAGRGTSAAADTAAGGYNGSGDY